MIDFRVHKNREVFLGDLTGAFDSADVQPSAPITKTIVRMLAEVTT